MLRGAGRRRSDEMPLRAHYEQHPNAAAPGLLTQSGTFLRCILARLSSASGGARPTRGAWAALPPPELHPPRYSSEPPRQDTILLTCAVATYTLG